MADARFGWKAGAEQFGPNELIDYSMAAEEPGFDLLDMSGREVLPRLRNLVPAEVRA